MNSQSKTIAIISYLTIIGWVMALIMRQSEEPKSELSRFHLRQSLGLIIVGVIGWYLLSWLAGLLNFWLLFNAFRLGLLVYWVLGLVNAIQGEKKYLPFIGEFFDEKLDFIK